MLARRGRENAQQKGLRLLLEGRLRIVRVDGDFISAECRGDSGAVYRLGYDHKRKQWRCQCPARTACSHLSALWMVTAVER